MHKRPTRDSSNQPRSSKPFVTGHFGSGKKAPAPAGSTTLGTVVKDGTKLFYRDSSGKRQIIEVRDAPPTFGKVKGFQQGKVLVARGALQGFIPRAEAGKAPVRVHRKEMNDPHLTLLSNSAFDAFTETLDRPPAPSEGAKQAVARARLWRR